jgi:hypothetical protein
MQELGVKISDSKIGNEATEAETEGWPGQEEGGKVVDAVDAGHAERAARQDARSQNRGDRPAVDTLVAMAYDQKLAERIRQLIGNDPELTEKKMFGGRAFLIRGNMAIAASGQGGAMVRVDPAQSDALEATTKATLVNMRGRDMPGWLRISSTNLRTDEQLAPWVEISIRYARSLPPT